jgi:hypothetical protein
VFETPSSLSVDPWEQLETYRERYDIEDQLGRLTSLERSITRRHARARALRRRQDELESQLETTRKELTAVESEIARSDLTGRLLVEEVLSRVKEEMGEVWSPTPILGYRLWAIDETGLRGAKVRWQRPRLGTRCLNRVPGEDVPHSTGKCGPPPCGIYVTKRLDVLRRELRVDDEPGYAVGVVAMTGKVIEHELGYRAASAEVLAIVARGESSTVATDEPARIERLFNDPKGELDAHRGAHLRGGADRFLEQWKERRETWTWDPRSG